MRAVFHILFIFAMTLSISSPLYAQISIGIEASPLFMNLLLSHDRILLGNPKGKKVILVVSHGCHKGEEQLILLEQENFRIEVVMIPYESPYEQVIIENIMKDAGMLSNDDMRNRVMDFVKGKIKLDTSVNIAKRIDDKIGFEFYKMSGRTMATPTIIYEKNSIFYAVRGYINKELIPFIQ